MASTINNLSTLTSVQIWDAWVLLPYFERREQIPKRPEVHTWIRIFGDSNIGYCDMCNIQLLGTQKYYCAMEAPESLTCRFYSGHFRPICYTCHIKLGNLTIPEYREREQK
jgi:hypothetical protein